MVKQRKTGRRAPPKVHAGESVAPVAGDGEDGVSEEAVEPGDAGHAEDPGAAEDAPSAEVSLTESGLETGPEPLEPPIPDLADADDVAVDEGVSAPGEAVADVVAPEPSTGLADDAAEAATSTIADDDVDEAMELVAPAAHPVPGVVLSDVLPLDPEDDLRHVEGEASQRLVSILESLLFSAAKPLSVKDLRKVLQETSQHQIQLALRHLMQVTQTRGVVLAQVAGGFQLRTHPDNAIWVQKMLQAKPARLSRTQIETLAIVAYRQPVTRPEIDDIRGVDSGAVLKSLLERELIQIVGRKEEPGRPLLYGTTVRFLEFFNLRGLRDLPTLRDFRDLSDESKATLRQRLGDLQIAEALGQGVLGFPGGEGPEGSNGEGEAEAGADREVPVNEAASTEPDDADARSSEAAEADAAADVGEPASAAADDGAGESDDTAAAEDASNTTATDAELASDDGAAARVDDDGDRHEADAPEGGDGAGEAPVNDATEGLPAEEPAERSPRGEEDRTHEPGHVEDDGAGDEETIRAGVDPSTE